MRKILLVSGCSFTDKNFRSEFHPEMACNWKKWPELLGNYLDMDVVNLGRCGSGNEYIYSSIIEKALTIGPENIGLIIPAWSQCQRRDWMTRSGRWENNRNDDKGHLRYHIHKSLRYYYSLQLFCENLNIPYKQCQMIEIVKKPVDKIDYDNAIKYIQELAINEAINKNNFIGYPMILDAGGFNIQWKVTSGRNPGLLKRFSISKEDSHPNAYGHKLIADFLFKNVMYEDL